jgi:hypothetical protein
MHTDAALKSLVFLNSSWMIALYMNLSAAARQKHHAHLSTKLTQLIYDEQWLATTTTHVCISQTSCCVNFKQWKMCHFGSADEMMAALQQNSGLMCRFPAPSFIFFC